MDPAPGLAIDGTGDVTRFDVALRGLCAAVASGALCALGFLAITGFTDPEVAGDIHARDVLVMLIWWAFFAAPAGAFAGVWLGIVPFVVGVTLWPWLDRCLGTRSAIDVAALVVAILGGTQVVVIATMFDLAPRESFGWSAGAALVSGLTLRVGLRLGARPRRPVPASRGY